MKQIFIYLSLTFFGIISFAQTTKTDSLISDINKADPKLKIALLIELSDIYSKSSIEKSLYCSKKAVEIADSLNLNTELGDAFYSLGYNFYKYNEYDSSIFYLNQALDQYKSLHNRAGIALCYNRLGNSFQLKSQNQIALDFYNQALIINESLQNNIEIGRSLTNKASIFRIYGKYEEAIEFDLKALKLYENDSYNDGIAWTSLNIARLLKELGDYEKAINYVNRALSIYEDLEKNEENKTGVILCLNELGTIYHSMGNVIDALKQSERVLEMNQENRNKYGISNSLANIGKIYFELHKYPAAINYLNDALNLKHELADSIGLPEILNYLGNAHLQLKNYEKAEAFFHQGFIIAKEKNLRSDITESYFNYSKLYSRQENYKDALKNFVEYTNLKDSLNLKGITQLEMQYEFDKQQKEIEFEQQQLDIIQKEKLRRQKILTYSIAIGFLFLLILTFLIYINYKRKKIVNIKLEHQNNEIKIQKEEIEVQQKVITDSIRYASRIQNAILPHGSDYSKILPEHFIYYGPRDLVSGDFYWFLQKENKLILVAADCTGHGVPGAFMSMLGISLLNEVVNRNNIIEPNKALDELRKGVIEALHQKKVDIVTSDGMDMTYCLIDLETLSLEFAGAYNPIYIVRKENGEYNIHIIKGNKMPVGVYLKELYDPFSKQVFQLQKNDILYMFTDGYYDQFGDNSEEKFKPKRFRELLLNIQEYDLQKQKELIISNFENWKGNVNQMDDVLVMGFKF